MLIFFDWDMAVWGSYRLLFERLQHFKILAGKRVHGRDWIRIRDVVVNFPQPDYRKSKFGLCHAIKQIELYCMTKSEFWFSMIPPSRNDHNFLSSVFPNYTVPGSYYSNYYLPLGLPWCYSCTYIHLEAVNLPGHLYLFWCSSLTCTLHTAVYSHPMHANTEPGTSHGTSTVLEYGHEYSCSFEHTKLN